MLKSEMQHQFWITKKTFQRKLGTKEDENILSSDAELDSKIEVFKSINETSSALSKIIDQYQERLCILSQEECVFGRYLKEVGKRSKSTGQSITNTGKIISYCGQQRMCVRLPLMRLHHEVEVFRSRAVSDTRTTINCMEKERTEYRAALAWMKSISSQLDPDTGKGLTQFRMAQTHVRNAKQIYDKIAMDCIQKIDLLAAARCNMFSHALVSYMTELLQFSKKTATTIEAISKALLKSPRYDFSLLKDLSQKEGNSCVPDCIENIDQDQSTFFMSEYNDNEGDLTKLVEKQDSVPTLDSIISNTSLKETPIVPIHNSYSEIPEPNLICSDEYSSKADNSPMEYSLVNEMASTHSANSKIQHDSSICRSNCIPISKTNISKNANAWMDIFAKLDPLTNSEEFDQKLIGNKKNFQQT